MSATETAIIGLSEETIDELRELRRLNIDSAKGFEECSEIVKDHGVRAAFVEIASVRREQAKKLATQIEWNEGKEEEHGSYLAALHRAWIKVREACSSDDVAAVIEESKRGEQMLCDAYANAISACVGSPIYVLLTEQRNEVKRVCERLESLCDVKST